MTSRLKGLDALNDAAIKATPAIYVITIEGIPRTGLYISEVAKITRLSEKRVRQEIQAGRIKVITGGNALIVPVSEIPVIMSWAQYDTA